MGIDIAAEPQVVAAVDASGAGLITPTPFAEDAAGYTKLRAVLGAATDTLVVMEATGHYWKNLFTMLVTDGFAVALVNPLPALAAYVGVIPALRQSGKRLPPRAALSPIGHAGLRAALWMPTLTAVRKPPWLRASYERVRARGKLPQVALVAAMRKLLVAVYAVAKYRRPFVPDLAESCP